MWARRQDLNIDRVTREREIEIWVLYERRPVWAWLVETPM